MAGLTDGYIYLIESDAGDNQNWLHAPNDIVIGNFTEGTDYVKLQMPSQYKKNFFTGVVVKSGSGGNEYDLRSARRWYKILTQGIETSKTNADLIESFCMSERHTSGLTTTFVRYYLIIRESSTVYVKFTDSGGTRRDYCKGIVLGGDVTWTKSRSLVAVIKLDFRSVW